MNSVYRSVIRTERFNEEFREIEPDLKKQEYFIRRVEWPLARDPLIGFRTETPNLYGLHFRHLRSDIVIYYSFNDQQIFLESIRLEEYEPE